MQSSQVRIQEETMSGRSRSADEQHLTYLAYRSGYCLARYLNRAVFYRWLANGEDPIPAHLDEWAAESSTYVKELARLTPAKQPWHLDKRAKRVCNLVEESLRELRESWNGEDHRADIETKRSLEEGDNWSPLDAIRGRDPAWNEIPVAACDFWEKLPERLVQWAALGSCIARVLYLAVGYEAEATRFADVPKRLQKMHNDPLLLGLAVRLTEKAYQEWLQNEGSHLDHRYDPYRFWFREQALQLDDELLERLLAQTSPASGAADAASPVDNPVNQVSTETLAIAVAKDHPEWTMLKLAKVVGVHRSTLYRMSTFRNFWDMLRSGRRDKTRPGVRCQGRDGSSYIDAVDEPDGEEEGP
jgi:hypothetical protein